MRIPIVVLVLVILTGPVLAQEPGPDTIGLWFDEGATINVINDPQPMQFFSGYLVIHAATHDQIAGIECGIEFPDGVYCIDWEYPPGFDTWGSPNNVIVTWYPPLDPDPDLVVARFDYLIVDVPDLPAFFVLGPTVPSSFPDTRSPGYGYWEGGDVFLQPLDYVFGDPAAARLEPGVVVVESRSLSAVKDLFD